MIIALILLGMLIVLLLIGVVVTGAGASPNRPKHDEPVPPWFGGDGGDVGGGD